jgi:hypothetical protein
MDSFDWNRAFEERGARPSRSLQPATRQVESVKLAERRGDFPGGRSARTPTEAGETPALPVSDCMIQL